MIDSGSTRSLWVPCPKMTDSSVHPRSTFFAPRSFMLLMVGRRWFCSLVASCPQITFLIHSSIVSISCRDGRMTSIPFETSSSSYKRVRIVVGDAIIPILFTCDLTTCFTVRSISEVKWMLCRVSSVGTSKCAVLHATTILSWSPKIKPLQWAWD